MERKIWQAARRLNKSMEIMCGVSLWRWQIVLLAFAALAADVIQAPVDAQEKTRRAERNARRSQQSTETDADRETAAANPNLNSSATTSERADSRKSESSDESSLTLRDVIGFAATRSKRSRTTRPCSARPKWSKAS